jgi:hypothetical protein
MGHTKVESEHTNPYLDWIGGCPSGSEHGRHHSDHQTTNTHNLHNGTIAQCQFDGRKE